MGRKKIEIVKLPTELERKITYSKRRECVLRKAHQLSVLCDIDVVLIMFSCSGKRDYFSSQPWMGKILERFIQNIPNMSENARENLQDSQQEIERDDIKLKLLELQKKMLYPGMKAFNSKQEFMELIQGLQRIRLMVAERRVIESQQHSLNQSYNRSESTQKTISSAYIDGAQSDATANVGATATREYMQQMEAPIFGMEYPSSYSVQPGFHQNAPWSILMQQLQEEPETGMQGQLLGGEYMQQMGVQVPGMEDPSFFQSVPQNIPTQQPQAAPGEAGMWDPLQGEDPMQQLGVQEFRRNQSLSSIPLFSVHEQNVYIPTSMSKEVKLESRTCSYDASDITDVGALWW